MDKSYPVSYQSLAYLYAQKNTEKDFLEAHKTIDNAIFLADSDKDKAIFLDAKGEIYLIQGNEPEASRYHKLAINANREYFSNHKTRLYSHFLPPDKSLLPKPERSEPDDSTKLRQELYSRFTEIVRKVARDELQLIQSIDNLKTPEYEELVSIGFIALNHNSEVRPRNILAG